MKLERGKIASLFAGVMLRRPVVVTLVALFASLSSILYATINLEFRTARLDLIASGERYKRLDQEYSREFEDPAHQVVVVIQSDRPERAKAFASALAKRWEADNTSIESVFYRVNLDALKKKALLYLSEDDLLALKEKLQKHEGLLRELAASSSLQNLFTLINREITSAMISHTFTGFLLEEEGGAEQEPVDLSLLISWAARCPAHPVMATIPSANTSIAFTVMAHPRVWPSLPKSPNIDQPLRSLYNSSFAKSVYGVIPKVVLQKSS